METAPDVVVCVVDASNLERNLFMVTQIMDLGLPVVVALNMVDAATGAGIGIDAAALSRSLAAPVVPMVARQGEGLPELKRAILSRPSAAPARRWTLMDAVDARLPALMARLRQEVPSVPETHAFMEVLRALTEEAALVQWEDQAPDFSRAIVALRKEYEGRGVAYRHAEVMGRYAWIGPVAQAVSKKEKDPSELSVTDRIDAVATHRVLGPVFFFVLLALVFQAVFSWAVPAMDAVEAGIGALGGLVTSLLPAGMATDLLVDGVIAGVGNVVVFLPQILLLFFFLGLMEDSGYMARTAFIMDRVMKRVGLSGGSVLPLLSSYACAIPGIMAARTLDNERDRIITIMVAPLMSCSARLPVYTLFIAAFIPAGTLFGFLGYQGLTMFAMYFMGTAMAFVAAWALKRLVFRGSSSYFVMELPPYRRPRMRQVLWRMIQRSKIFAVRAGRIIFTLSIVLWFMASFPKVDPGPEMALMRQEAEAEREAAYAAALAGASAASVADVVALLEEGESARVDSIEYIEPERVDRARLVHAADLQFDARSQELGQMERSRQIRGSMIGLFGRALEPVMQPLGFDWKMSAGIVAAFAAREVIVSTLGIIYSVGEVDETSVALREQLKADRYPDGRPVFTALVALSLLVFFVFALQCMSTLAIARRELNSWLWPGVMWLYMTGLAYVFSLAIYQGGRLLGFQ